MHLRKLLPIAFLVPALCGAQSLSSHWEDLTSNDFVKALAQSGGTCALPFGIIEKHGPTGPMGTDLINVRHVAELAAKQSYTILFPAYYVGRYSRRGISPARSRTARICRWKCCRRQSRRWRATDAARS